MTLGGPPGVLLGGPEYFDEIRVDPVSAQTRERGLIIQPYPWSKFWDFDTIISGTPYPNPIIIILK